MLSQIENDRIRIEEYLNRCFCESAPYLRLLEAMRYSLLAGGKRVRPILTLAFCRACGADDEIALPFAAGIEMLHTYSLIHDDLPCMDNDTLRRGKPTCHIVYGQAGAVLAGDALLTAAFGQLAAAPLPADIRIRAVQELSSSAGPYGMVGGQQMDLEAEDRNINIDRLILLQSLKTGAIIRCACRLGVLAAEGTEAQLQAAAEYANAVGLAFQIRDDILDRIGSMEQLGKNIGSDSSKNKSTFASTCGVEECQKRVQMLSEQAAASLQGREFVQISFLQDFARALALREN